MNRKTLISLFAALLAGSLLQAQTLPSLLVNADAAALGAGGSAIAADATAFALENNTAAIPFSDKTVFAGVSYGLWQPSSPLCQDFPLSFLYIDQRERRAQPGRWTFLPV